MRAIQFALLAIFLCPNAQAEFKLGRKHKVKNDAMEFNAVELQIEGKFVGFIDENSAPINFSEKFYVYASCPVDKSTGEPNGYCLNWEIYDVAKKIGLPLSIPGLTFASVPSFSWPYIAYVKVPSEITEKDFNNGSVEVSCTVFEWPRKNIAAQHKIRVNVGAFETDVPAFYPPKFTKRGKSLEVTCAEYSGNDDKPMKSIATVSIPDALKSKNSIK